MVCFNCLGLLNLPTRLPLFYQRACLVPMAGEPVLVCSGRCTLEKPQTEWLDQQRLISSGLWRLEVRGEGVSGVGFLGGLCPWLPAGLPVSSSVSLLRV